MNIHKMVFCIVSIFLTMNFVHVDRLYAQDASVDTSLPKNITETLEKNATELDPISLVWRRERTTSMKFETLIKKINCLYDCGFLEPVNSVFMWQGGHAYLCFTDKNAVAGQGMPTAYEAKTKGLELVETIKERSFNGETCYIGSGHEQSTLNTPTLLVYSADQAKEKLPFFTICYPEYLACAGYRFPLDAPELKESHASLVLYLINNGKLISVKEVRNGAADSLLFVEIVSKETWTKEDHRYRFWLSKKLNFAVERLEIESLNGKMAYQVVNSDFFQVPDKGVYLPKKCTQKCFTFMTIPGIFSGTPLFEEQYRLVDISTKKINEAQFDLQRKYDNPGTMVGNHVLSKDSPHGVQYTVPANPADLDRVIEAAITGGEFVPTPLPTTGAVIVRWLLVVLGVCMILFALYVRFIKKD
jgi:hypothetical protein